MGCDGLGGGIRHSDFDLRHSFGIWVSNFVLFESSGLRSDSRSPTDNGFFGRFVWEELPAAVLSG
jgi:hypothetical protein